MAGDYSSCSLQKIKRICGDQPSQVNCTSKQAIFFSNWQSLAARRCEVRQIRPPLQRLASGEGFDLDLHTGAVHSWTRSRHPSETIWSRWRNEEQNGKSRHLDEQPPPMLFFLPFSIESNQIVRARLFATVFLSFKERPAGEGFNTNKVHTIR